MSLENTKKLLGVDNEQVDILYEQYKSRLLSYLNKQNPLILTVPTELEYILMELTIARFNRIGSEGMESETMDGHSAKYQALDLSDYYPVIDEYLIEDTPPSDKVVRFL